MLPVLFRIGPLTITAYGVTVAAAAGLAGWTAARSFEDRGLGRSHAWDILVLAVVVGFASAKVYYAVLTGEPGMLLARGGFVWYGGLIGGAVTVVYLLRRRGIPFLEGADAFAPSLALGHAVGHLACFFSGDSYGLPSAAPWAIAFPRGMPPSTAGNLRRFFGVDLPASIPDEALLRVHPTMLYSAAALLLLFGLLWYLRERFERPGRLFSIYLVLAGTERFLVEFLRAKDDRLLWGGFTVAQLIAVLILLGGLVLMSRPTATHPSYRRPVPS